MNRLVRWLPVLAHVLILSGCGNFRLIGSSALADDDVGFLVGPVLQNAGPQSIGIMWETTSGDEAVVDFGLTPGMGQTTLGETFDSVHRTKVHHVTLRGLEPDTKYFYYARTGDQQSPIFQFRTPPAKGATKSFRFAVYSDCQARPNVHRRIVDQGVYGTLPQGVGTPDDALGFVLVAGDVVQDGTEYAQFKQRFFDPTRNVSPYVPYYAAIGNHERDDKAYFDYLNLPRNGSAGYEEHWYSFDYGNTHVIGLDTNAAYQIPKQLEWLDQDLAAVCKSPDTDMVFAYFHHPWKSELWLPGEEGYSGEIVQRLEKTLKDCGKIGAYFFGHTHGYSRGQAKETPFYAVNVGSAGGTIDTWGDFPQRDYPEFQKTYDEYGVLIVDVNPDGRPGFKARRLTFGDEATPKNGDVQDDFRLFLGEKSPDKPEIVNTLGSEFRDADGGKLLEAEWQIAPRPDGFGAPEESLWLRVENVFHDVDTMAGVDIKTSPYKEGESRGFVRVRYRDDGLAWSPWSEPVQIPKQLSSR